MRHRVLLAVVWAVALALPAAIAPAEPAPALAPAAPDWTATVVQTEEGGFRMGNPDARVRLVVYASITCPHCATFAASGTEPLMADYVRGGQVSWEFRPFLIFPSDPGIFQLLACRGPTEFFPLVEQLYSSQAEWAGRLEALSRKRALRLEELQQTSPTSHSAALIRAARLDRFFRQSGMSEAAITACLADEAGLRRLADANLHGVEQDGVIGTPTFFINGIKQDAYNWSSLEPLLRGAMRQ